MSSHNPGRLTPQSPSGRAPTPQGTSGQGPGAGPARPTHGFSTRPSLREGLPGHRPEADPEEERGHLAADLRVSRTIRAGKTLTFEPCVGVHDILDNYGYGISDDATVTTANGYNPNFGSRLENFQANSTRTAASGPRVTGSTPAPRCPRVRVFTGAPSSFGHKRVVKKRNNH